MRNPAICGSKHMRKSGPVVVFCAGFINNVQAVFFCGKMGFVGIWCIDRPGASEIGQKRPKRPLSTAKWTPSGLLRANLTAAAELYSKILPINDPPTPTYREEPLSPELSKTRYDDL